jgi:hypothetical protein
VAAVVVAAVIVAKKASDSDDQSIDQPTRANVEGSRSLRQTVVNIFRGPRGGVDVMGNSGKGHQSISARAPAMK